MFRRLKSKKGFAFPTVLGTFVLVTGIVAGLFIMISNMTLMVSSDIETTETRFELRAIARLTLEAVDKNLSSVINDLESQEDLATSILKSLKLENSIDLSLVITPIDSNNYSGIITVTALNHEPEKTNEEFVLEFRISRSTESSGDDSSDNDSENDTTIVVTSSGVMVENTIDSFIATSDPNFDGPSYDEWMNDENRDDCDDIEDSLICYLYQMSEDEENNFSIAVSSGDLSDSDSNSTIFTTDTTTSSGNTFAVTLITNAMIFVDGNLTLSVNNSGDAHRVLIGNFYITGDLNVNIEGNGRCGNEGTPTFTFIGTFFIGGNFEFDDDCNTGPRGHINLGVLDSALEDLSLEPYLRPTFLFVNGTTDISARGFRNETQNAYIFTETFIYTPRAGFAGDTTKIIDGTIRANNVLIQQDPNNSNDENFYVFDNTGVDKFNPLLIVNESFNFTSEQLKMWGIPHTSSSSQDGEDFEIIEIIPE